MTQGEIHLRGLALREQNKDFFDSLPKAKGYTLVEEVSSYVKMGIFMLELPLVVGCLIIELVKMGLNRSRNS